METTKRTRRPRAKFRAHEAEASLGPIGNLFASAAVASVLTTFVQNPQTNLTLGEIKEQSGNRAKGTVQSGLQTLIAARLVHREGRGNRTRYRYAADRELGWRMADLIRASQKESSAGTVSDIPWLDNLMRTVPRTPVAKPFGDRTEHIPSPETTARALARADAIVIEAQPRTRPGLRTRR